VALARGTVIVVGPQSLLGLTDEVVSWCVKAYEYLDEMGGRSGVSEVGTFDARKKFTSLLFDFTVESERVLRRVTCWRYVTGHHFETLYQYASLTRLTLKGL
jgi:hypothetical protein